MSPKRSHGLQDWSKNLRDPSFLFDFCLIHQFGLLQVEQQRQEEAERAGKALDEREAAHAALKKTERELKQVKVEQTREQAQLKEVSASRADAQSKKAKLDLDVADLEEQRQTSTAAEVKSIQTVTFEG